MGWDLFKKKVFLFSFSFVLLAALFSGITYLYITSLPEYSVREAGLAVQNNDWDDFNRYVNLESILEKSADSLVEEYMAQKNMPESQKTRIRYAVKSNGPQIISFFESHIKNALFADKATSEIKKSPTLEIKSKPPSPFRKNKLTLIDIQNKEENNGTAILNLFFISESEPDQPKKMITLKLKQRSSYWQIVEIININEIVKWPEVQTYLKN